MELGKGLLKMLKKILDTNFILRFLLKDVPEMFEIACNDNRSFIVCGNHIGFCRFSVHHIS